jgi:integrase
MSVRKRTWTTRLGEPKESWIVDYTDQNGERHIQTFAKKKDADAYHATVKVDVRKGMHVAPSKSISIAEAAEAWIKRVQAGDRERATLKMYREHINLHIVPRIGRLKLAHLTQKRVEDFRDDLLQKLSRPLAGKVLTSFKSLLRVAHHVHVADGIRVERNKRGERKLEAGRDIPTPAEIKRLIAATRTGRQRAFLLVAALCGLRASELRGLRWSDVDLKAATLHVRQRADRYGVIGSPKSASGRRQIPLPPEALSELRSWRLACPKIEADLVFPTRGGRAEDHASVWRSLERVMMRAGIVDKKGISKYGPHALRHFFASWCINRKPEGRELPPKEVQVLLGHSSIVMTLDVYGHLFPRSDDSAELAAASGRLFA